MLWQIVIKIKTGRLSRYMKKINFNMSCYEYENKYIPDL